MNRLRTCPVLLVALALPVLAQEPARPTAAAAPILVLETSRPELARIVAMRLQHAGRMPEMPAGGHLVVSLGADRKASVASGRGDSGLIDLVGDPAALMEVFAEDIDAVKPMVVGTLTLALQAQGMTPKEVAALMKTVFEFPKQLQRIDLKVVGDPDQAPADGVDVSLVLVPKAGAPFAAFVSGLQPCAQGVPVLAAGDATMTMRLSLAPDSLATVFAPFRDWAINLTNQGGEQRKQAGAVFDRWMKIYDGGLSASFGGEQFHGHMLIGALDAGELQKVVGSEEYLAMLKGQKMQNRDVEIEVTPAAFEHRGVKVTKSRMSGYEPNPIMPDGAMDSYFGAAANYMFATFGSPEADAKAAIDAIVDQKVKRAPLPGGALLDVAIDLKRIVAMVRAAAGEDMPAKATLSLGKRGDALALHVLVK